MVLDECILWAKNEIFQGITVSVKRPLLSIPSEISSSFVEMRKDIVIADTTICRHKCEVGQAYRIMSS